MFAADNNPAQHPGLGQNNWGVREADARSGGGTP
jgi:hypothetical protein